MVPLLFGVIFNFRNGHAETSIGSMQRRKANLKSKSFSLITFCSEEISFLVLQVSVRANGREGRRAIGSQPKSTSLPGLLRSKPNSSAATIIPWSRFLEPYSCWSNLSHSQWDIRYLMQSFTAYYCHPKPFFAHRDACISQGVPSVRYGLPSTLLHHGRGERKDKTSIQGTLHQVWPQWHHLMKYL